MQPWQGEIAKAYMWHKCDIAWTFAQTQGTVWKLYCKHKLGKSMLLSKAEDGWSMYGMTRWDPRQTKHTKDPTTWGPWAGGKMPESFEVCCWTSETAKGNLDRRKRYSIFSFHQLMQRFLQKLVKIGIRMFRSDLLVRYKHAITMLSWKRQSAPASWACKVLHGVRLVRLHITYHYHHLPLAWHALEETSLRPDDRT